MVKDTYYHIEDEPTGLQAVQAYKEAIAVLSPERVERTANKIKKLIAFNKDQAFNGETETARSNAKLMLKDLQAISFVYFHQDSALSGATNAVNALWREHRDMSDELYSLMRAIQSNDRNHPVLKLFAAIIETEAHELQHMHLEADVKYIVRRMGGTPEQADTLIALLRDDRDWTQEQQQLFRQFIDVLEAS